MRLYKSGSTIQQVVGQVGWSYGTIRKVLHENGVALRTAGAMVHLSFVELLRATLD